MKKVSPGLLPASRSFDRNITKGGNMVEVASKKLKMKIQEQSKKNWLRVGGAIKSNFENNRKRLARLVRPCENRQGSPAAKAELSPFSKKEPLGSFALPSLSHQGHPSYKEFHKHEALPASLRSEREARIKSFENLNGDLTEEQKGDFRNDMSQ